MRIQCGFNADPYVESHSISFDFLFGSSQSSFNSQRLAFGTLTMMVLHFRDILQTLIEYLERHHPPSVGVQQGDPRSSGHDVIVRDNFVWLSQLKLVWRPAEQGIRGGVSRGGNAQDEEHFLSYS